MLELRVHNGEEFVTLEFEHSLLSLSKWESIHKKSFLSNEGLKPTEQIDYYQCMLVTPGVDREIVTTLSPEDYDTLWSYINTPQSASSVPRDESQSGTREIQTSELLYTWMVLLEIPFHPTETWHLSRASMLIEMVSYKKTPPKKKSTMDRLSDIMKTNNANKEALQTRG